MSRAYVLSREAECDVDGTIEFLLKNSGRKQAAAFIDRLDEALALIAHSPYIGHRRPDAAPEPYRCWPFGSYLLVYSPATKPLQVARVVHAARDLPRALINLKSTSNR